MQHNLASVAATPLSGPSATPTKVTRKSIKERENKLYSTSNHLFFFFLNVRVNAEYNLACGLLTQAISSSRFLIGLSVRTSQSPNHCLKLTLGNYDVVSP